MIPDNLPPVVSILLSEPAPTAPDIRRWYRRIGQELQKQAGWSINNFRYPAVQAQSADLLAVPTGALDPCNSAESCPHVDCRAKRARQFARTTGLYSTSSVLVDELTFKLAVTGPYRSDAGLQQLLGDVRVLHELQPLISAGVVSFRQPPFDHYCEEHGGREFERLTNHAADAVLKELQVGAEIRRADNGNLEIDPSELYGYSVTMTMSAPGDGDVLDAASRKEVLSSCARTMVKRTVAAFRDATQCSGTVLSSSRVSMLALRSLDHLSVCESPNFEDWEGARTAQLPWIRELSPAQIVLLRELAANALPRLRESFAHLKQSNDASEQIKKLREDALDVSVELQALRQTHESLFRNVAGVLSISAAVYGFAADAIPATGAVVGLMSVLGLLHTAEHKENAEALRLRAKPGYVLIKAQELLEHADAAS